MLDALAPADGEVPAGAVLRANDAGSRAAEALVTVVVPFYAYDVAPLARRLVELAAGAQAQVALLFLDDGSADTRFRDSVWEAVRDAPLPATVGHLAQNVGRARVRNILCALARSPYLLYLDADMWPDRGDFLQRYLAWAQAGDADVIYGGRSAERVVLTGAEYSLHQHMTREREALPAVVRRASPAFHFYSCNFLVRRSILRDFPLDARFRGWGWEDCEWAARVSQQHDIRHEDNAASHLGLLTARQILSKYDESIENFTLMLQSRPEIVTPTALFRVARLVGRLRLAGVVRALARWVAEAAWLSVRLRMLGLMFYKAALYAPVARAPRA